MKNFDTFINEFEKTVNEFAEGKRKAAESGIYQDVVAFASSPIAKKLTDLAVQLEAATKKGELSEEQRKRASTIAASPSKIK